MGFGKDTETFLGWMDSIPDEVRDRAQLCIYHSTALSNSLQFDAAESRLHEAEGAIGDMEDSSEETQAMRGQVAALRSTWAHLPIGIPDFAQSIALSKQALELLPGDSWWRNEAVLNLAAAHLELGDEVAAAAADQEGLTLGEKAGNISMLLAATLGRAYVESSQRNLRQAHLTVRRGLEQASEHGVEKIRQVSQLHYKMGELHYEWNELDTAANHLNASIELGLQYQNDAFLLVSPYVQLAFVRQAQGDPIAALDLIEQATQLLEKFDLTEAVTTTLSPLRVRLWLAQGKLDDASLWAAGSGLSVDDDATMARVNEYHVFLLVLIAQGKLDDAMGLVEPIFLV